MIIDSFKIVVKEHKRDWNGNIHTINIPYRLKIGDFIFRIRGEGDNFYACEIVEVGKDFIKILDNRFWARGTVTTIRINPKVYFEPFPMFNHKPNFRNKTNLDFYFGEYGGWEKYTKRYIDEWPRNFNNIMFSQLSMF